MRDEHTMTVLGALVERWLTLDLGRCTAEVAAAEEIDRCPGRGVESRAVSLLEWESQRQGSRRRGGA